MLILVKFWHLSKKLLIIVQMMNRVYGSLFFAKAFDCTIVSKIIKSAVTRWHRYLSIVTSFVCTSNIYLDTNTKDIYTKFSRNLKNTSKETFRWSVLKMTTERPRNMKKWKCVEYVQRILQSIFFAFHISRYFPRAGGFLMKYERFLVEN